MITGKIFDLHVSNLSPFEYDPEHTDPKEVAIQDAGEFHVDSIIDHKGERNLRSSMKFLVKWTGYGEEDNSWEPYSALRDNEKLHEYLRLHRMTSLIPKEHK